MCRLNILLSMISMTWRMYIIYREVGMMYMCCLRSWGSMCCWGMRLGIGFRIGICQVSRIGIGWRRGRWRSCWYKVNRLCWILLTLMCSIRLGIWSCTDTGIMHLLSNLCNLLRRISKSHTEIDKENRHYWCQWNTQVSKLLFDYNKLSKASNHWHIPNM